MPIDYATLDVLRQHHPAWRLLVSPHAPLIASFFYTVFVARNERVLLQADLVEALEDTLFALRESLGDDKFPKSALDYLNDWAAPDKGWLRKFYRQGNDDACFDLTPATEKAISWLDSLQQRSFVGTESRLLILFELLRQMSEGSTENPEQRLHELRRRRDELDAEIERAERGEVELLDDTGLKDRFMQFDQQARELLSDFREVEHNFRQLDRSVRERIAQWDGSRGDLLEAIMAERDAIDGSDQGASFHAFWDFLMSPERKEEFSERLDAVLDLPALATLQPDRRLRGIHYDWLEAGDYTQRTVAQLSQQLRRFLDDQAWLENRRIMELLQGIEGKVLAQRDALFRESEPFTAIDLPEAELELPLERPLFRPPRKPRIADIRLEAGDEQVDAGALYTQLVVDKGLLRRHIRQALQQRTQISLVELCQQRPLTQGLAELVAYLELSDGGAQGDQLQAVVDDTREDVISWQGNDGTGQWVIRRARMPRVVYLRKAQ